MYSVTDNFLRAIRESGKRKTVVDVYLDGALIASDIAVVSGTITDDRKSTNRRSGSIIVGDPGLVPTLTDTIAPYGTEFYVRTGVVYPNGTEELVPLGYFQVRNVSWNEGSGSIPAVEIFDRSKTVEGAELGLPVSFAGKTATWVIDHLVKRVIPDATVTIDPGIVNFTIPGGNLWHRENHWEVAVQLAESLAADLYFNRDGECILEPKPYIDPSTPNSSAVWDVDAGESGVLVSADRQISREGVYNVVQVYGAARENGSMPFGQAIDNYPSSPTRWDGPFGRQGTKFFDDSLTTDTQCQQVALTRLREVTGFQRAINFSAVPNPALDAGDIILVTYPDASTELHLIDSLTIPLGEGDLSGSTRSTAYSL